MKIKEKYDLKKVKQITTETPIGDCCELHFEDGTKFTIYAGEFIQLLAWLESEEEHGKQRN